MSLLPNSKSAYTAVIADDHPLILMGLEQALRKLKFLHIKAKCSNGQKALNAIKKHQPDFAILDIQMPELTGIDIAEHLFENKSKTQIILLTMFHDLNLFEKAKQLNVKGYLLKESMLNELENCLNAIIKGEEYLNKTMNVLQVEGEEKLGSLGNLSRMEKKVFQLIGEQKSSKEIAQLLFLSPKTIDNHRHNICKKLDISGGSNALLKYVVDFYN